jgi:peroxiredoxin
MTVSRPRRIRTAALALTLAMWPVVAAGQTSLIPADARNPALPFTVRTEAGGLAIHDLKGTVVLLDFMTTTCPACKEASRGIQQVYAELGPRGFRPVAVAIDVPSAADGRPYVQAHGLTFPFATAARAEVLTYVAHPFNRPFLVPTIVLLDRQGRISLVEVGWKGPAALRASVLALLEEPAKQE